MFYDCQLAVLNLQYLHNLCTNMPFLYGFTVIIRMVFHYAKVLFELRTIQATIESELIPSDVRFRNLELLIVRLMFYMC